MVSDEESMFNVDSLDIPLFGIPQFDQHTNWVLHRVHPVSLTLRLKSDKPYTPESIDLFSQAIQTSRLRHLSLVNATRNLTLSTVQDLWPILLKCGPFLTSLHFFKIADAPHVPCAQSDCCPKMHTLPDLSSLRLLEVHHMRNIFSHEFETPMLQLVNRAVGLDSLSMSYITPLYARLILRANTSASIREIRTLDQFAATPSDVQELKLLPNPNRTSSIIGRRRACGAPIMAASSSVSSASSIVASRSCSSASSISSRSPSPLPMISTRSLSNTSTNTADSEEEDPVHENIKSYVMRTAGIPGLQYLLASRAKHLVPLEKMKVQEPILVDPHCQAEVHFASHAKWIYKTYHGVELDCEFIFKDEQDIRLPL